MFSRRLLSVAGLPLIVGLAAFSAKAELITFAFEGRIDSIGGDIGFLGGSIRIGTPFAGTYTFDSTTPDAYPEFPEYGLYRSALAAFQVQIGPHHLMKSGNDNSIQLYNDLPEPPYLLDAYYVQERSTRLLTREAWVTMNLEDGDGTGLLTDALPLLPPPLAEFEENVLLVSDMFVSYYFSGPLTSLSLIPEPSSIALLVVGSPLLMFRRSR